MALLASAGAVCAYDETGSTTTLGQYTDTTLENYSTIVGYSAGHGNSSSGGYNTFIGALAGNIYTSGDANSFFLAHTPATDTRKRGGLFLSWARDAG